jgi:hypothetical protein
VNSFSSRTFGYVYYSIDPQVALSCPWGTDVVSLISISNVLAVAISVRVHGNRLDAKFLTGPEHSYGDLTAIGN